MLVIRRMLGEIVGFWLSNIMKEYKKPVDEATLMIYESDSGRIKQGESESVLSYLRLDGKCRCCRCRKIKDQDRFSSRMLVHKYPYCIDCLNETKDKYKIHAKNKRLKEVYGLTREQYELLVKKQKNKCAICKKTETHVNYKSGLIIGLTVDHCHKTGKCRALLCRLCNLMIGNSNDSTKTLKAAIKYLNKYESLEPLCQQN